MQNPVNDMRRLFHAYWGCDPVTFIVFYFCYSYHYLLVKTFSDIHGLEWLTDKYLLESLPPYVTSTGESISCTLA